MAHGQQRSELDRYSDRDLVSRRIAVIGPRFRRRWVARERDERDLAFWLAQAVAGTGSIGSRSTICARTLFHELEIFHREHRVADQFADRQFYHCAFSRSGSSDALQRYISSLCLCSADSNTCLPVDLASIYRSGDEKRRRLDPGHF